MIHTFLHSKEKIGDLGSVAKVRHGTVEVIGMSGGFLGESVTFDDGTHGMIMSILPETTEIMVLAKHTLKIGSLAARTGEPLGISVGDGLLTHVVNPMGYVIDERRHESADSELRPVDIPPQGISTRAKVNKFLTTGVCIVDMMVPIGEGQRELVIGNRKSGKSFFILSTVINQAKLGKICVLAMIGKRKSEIKRTEEILEKEGVIDKCIIVASTPDHSPGEIYLTPFTAMTIAEFFRDKGMDSLVVLDDMTNHAKHYRELSLIAGRFPGRESYPGDIFYVQSRIIERAGNFKLEDKKKEVSITCLPVAESVEADLTGYIQTNLMGMTDGHIFFDSDLFFKGIRPAVNIFLSVTRVGHQTQPEDLQKLSQETLKLLKRVNDLERFLRFGPEVTDQVKDTLDKGAKIWEFFRQNTFKQISVEDQIIAAGKILGIKNSGEKTK